MRPEPSLNESEERLRAIFSQSAAGIVQADLSGSIHLVNHRFCEIVGYSEAELLAMRTRDIIYVDDLPDYVRLLRKMVETGQNFEIEQRFVRKNGSLVWVANSISAVRDKNGHIWQAGAIVIDITERRRAQEVERSLAAIIASSNDAILGIDLNMRITSWNTGAEKLYGYSADEAVGRSVLMLVPEDRIEEEPAILRQVNTGLKVEPYETKRRRKDGQLVDVLLSVSPIHDAYGRIVGASKITHDISVRKDAERLQAVLVGELNGKGPSSGRSLNRPFPLIQRKGSKLPALPSNCRQERRYRFRLHCMSSPPMPQSMGRCPRQKGASQSGGRWRPIVSHPD